MNGYRVNSRPPSPFPERLQLAAGSFPLQVETHARARHLALRVCAATRTLRLTMPPGASNSAALAFLACHRGWIEREASRQLLPPVPFAPGTILPFAGGLLLLAAGPGRIAQRQGDRLLIPGSDDSFSGRARRWLGNEARTILGRESAEFAGLLGRPLRGVRVGDPRSRWGSCSSDGRIAYSWRLILAPAFVRRAVVAHEVAHLAEANHGPRFWSLAADLLGEPHTRARLWLRQNRAELLRFGAV